MKIGIITFHFPLNYGAVVQAYALQEYLTQHGHETYIIDYAPEYHVSRYSKGRTWTSCFNAGIMRIPWRIYLKLFFDLDRKRNHNFDVFKERYLKLCPFSEQSDFSEFDCILFGSDQIWNPNITNNRLDGVYFGKGFKCKTIAYAASNKTDTLTSHERDEFIKMLKYLDAVGVREKQLQTLLQPLTDKKVALNVDPTILATDVVYNKLNLRRPVKDRYVLIYELQNHSKVLSMAQKYAERIGAKVIALVGSTDFTLNKMYDQVAGPDGFLAYIKFAECIFTTSFHGTALSLVFNKPFYSVRQNNKSDIRIESILSQVGLLDRFVSMDDSVIVKEINYTEIDKCLQALRADSEEYLRQTMKTN